MSPSCPGGIGAANGSLQRPWYPAKRPFWVPSRRLLGAAQ